MCSNKLINKFRIMLTIFSDSHTIVSSYPHCRMLSHSQGSYWMVTSSIQLIVERWSVVSRFGQNTTDPYGIQSADLEVGCLLNLSSDSAIRC
ncbi:unnamed protein product [Schistosoma guineensis]|nr:unnamed protein product [Schistosoma guineensis]